LIDRRNGLAVWGAWSAFEVGHPIRLDHDLDFLASLAPKVLMNCKTIGSSATIWPLAYLIYQMIMGRQLFGNRPVTPSSVLSEMCAFIGNPSKSMMGKLHCLEYLGEQQDNGSSLIVQLQNELNAEFASVMPLLKLMLQWDLRDRISIKDVIKSAFISDSPSVNGAAELFFPKSVIVPDHSERPPPTEPRITATHLVPAHLPRLPAFL
jgi:serine/threonine protein kinase